MEPTELILEEVLLISLILNAKRWELSLFRSITKILTLVLLA